MFAVVNTYRRRNALIAAGEYLAADRVASREAVKNDPDLKTQAADELDRASRDFDKQLRAAYQHVVWLADTGDGQRGWADHRFEGDPETALNGSHVWKVLEAADKAFGTAQFNAKALSHNLQDRDYGKPLFELRDDFWRVPRLPLLPNGEKDLRTAIWEAVHAGELVIIDSDGVPREAHSDSEINLSSDMQRLGRKAAEEPDEPLGPAGGGPPPTGPSAGQRPAGEKQVAFSGTLTIKPPDRDAIRVMLDALRNSVEDGTLSWTQISVKAILPRDVADDLDTKATAAGMHTTVTDL